MRDRVQRSMAVKVWSFLGGFVLFYSSENRDDALSAALCRKQAEQERPGSEPSVLNFHLSVRWPG